MRDQGGKGAKSNIYRKAVHGIAKTRYWEGSARI